MSVHLDYSHSRSATHFIWGGGCRGKSNTCLFSKSSLQIEDSDREQSDGVQGGRGSGIRVVLRARSLRSYHMSGTTQELYLY